MSKRELMKSIYVYSMYVNAIEMDFIFVFMFAKCCNSHSIPLSFLANNEHGTAKILRNPLTNS